jgi:hypothetical protein
VRTTLVAVTGSKAWATVGVTVVAEAISASAKRKVFLIVVPLFQNPIFRERLSIYAKKSVFKSNEFAV